ncbi:MAG: hypothetical protein FJ148_26880 [Deltaproteobacteria bacterium]|nr:hypothetical protein [Deltaproteobacteria bacterium]
MASPSTSTERRSTALRRGAVAVVGGILLLAAGARAHEPQRLTSREIVRLAGTFGPPGATAKIVADVVVVAQGRERTLHATDWQVYALVVDQNAPLAPAPARVTLQGTRADLARIANARPEQRVAILAERRPDRSELFLLAVDLCPEE